MGTPSHLGHLDGVAAEQPSQAPAGAVEEAPDLGRWKGQDVPLLRPSSCIVKEGVLSSRGYLPTYLQSCDCNNVLRPESLSTFVRWLRTVNDFRFFNL